MNSLADTELLRARWRRALDRHALDRTSRDDFGLGGLATRLRSPSVQLLLLPPDPEAEALHIDSELWAWLEAHQSVDVDGCAIRLGNLQHPTAHAAALVRGYGRSESWRHYLALHRSGAIELGLGDRGGWDTQSPEGEPVRMFNLISVVVYTWALLKFGAAANERLSLNGPWQLAVGLLRTHGAHLGNLGQGWAEPGSFENTFGRCVEPNLLWHLGIDAWPDEEGQQRLAFSIGDRLEDAWGATQRRYLNHRGDRAGHLDVRRIA